MIAVSPLLRELILTVCNEPVVWDARGPIRLVAALALLVQRLLDRRLRDAGIEISATRALEALSTVRHVTFRVEGEGRRAGVAGGSPDARRVLKALKIGELRPPTPPAELAATVM